MDRPGRDCALVPTWDRRARAGQRGIVSCLAFAPGGGSLLAAGAFGGATALYDLRAGAQLLLLHGHCGGVTHARFSPDGNYLYTGARRDDSLLCWDVRATAGACGGAGCGFAAGYL